MASKRAQSPCSRSLWPISVTSSPSCRSASASSSPAHDVPRFSSPSLDVGAHQFDVRWRTGSAAGSAGRRSLNSACVSRWIHFGDGAPGWPWFRAAGGVYLEGHNALLAKRGDLKTLRRGRGLPTAGTSRRRSARALATLACTETWTWRAAVSGNNATGSADSPHSGGHHHEGADSLSARTVA